jgi:hypothetical protein
VVTVLEVLELEDQVVLNSPLAFAITHITKKIDLRFLEEHIMEDHQDTIVIQK